MTDTQLEATARELCRLRGQDADQEYAPGLACWQHAAIEVKKFIQIGMAIAAVMAKPKRKTKGNKTCRKGIVT